MAKFYDELDDMLRKFIESQHIFYCASAPNHGRINISPKGLDTFRILNSKRVAYLDLTGSENETAAHIIQNGRLTIMFCSFEERPLIVRLYGQGKVVHSRDEEWNGLHPLFPTLPGERQIIVLDIESILDTCGFAVPLYDYKGERSLLIDFACKQGDEGMNEYRHKKNLVSIDGLPTDLEEDTHKSNDGKRYWMLQYEKAKDFAERQGPFQEAHLKHVNAAAARNELVLAGSLSDPQNGAALLIFRVDSRKTVEEFARNDCYVTEGIVSTWLVREWDVVAGSKDIR